MKKILIKDCNINQLDRNIACIGYFDGIHIGHQKLIKETLKLSKKKKLKSSLICFNPDPEDIIFNKKSSYLYSYKNRLDIISEYGFDYVVVIEFNTDIMSINYKEFIDNYLNKLNIDTLICGYDYSFGYKANGNVTHLKKYGNFDLNIIDKVEYKNEKISSTRIKNELIKGNFKLVNKLLGRDYYLSTKCVKSSKKGSKWLVELKLNDNRLLLPNITSYKYGNTLFKFKNNRIYMETNFQIKENDLVEIEF